MNERRVPVHKDEWVERCAMQKVEIERLRNRIGQLEWQLEKEANRHGFRQAVKRVAALLNGRTV